MFKAKDKVVFVGADHPNFKAFRNIAPGELFEVQDVHKQGAHDMVWIKDRTGLVRNIRADRFLPAKRKTIFAVGDKVVIRKDVDMVTRKDADALGLRWFGAVGGWLAGQEATIKQVSERMNEDGITPRFYTIDICPAGYHYAAYFFEPQWEGTQYVAPPKFAEGDEVYVAKAPMDKAVVPKWNDKMDKTIGKKYKVKKVEKDYVILSNGLAYRFESLEKYDAVKHAPLKKQTLRNILTKIRDEARKKQLTGVCSYVMVHKHNKKPDELVIRDQYNDVCHARLAHQGYDGHKNAGEAVAVLDFVHGHKVYKEQKTTYLRWLDYIQNRSPWAPVYKAKSAKNAIISGLELDVNVSGDAIAGACIANRMGSEYPKMLKRWGYFRKHTKNENVAFLMAFAFDFDVEKEQKWMISEMGGGHSVLASYLNADKLFHFFGKGYDIKFLKPDGVAAKSYAQAQRYEVFKAMIGMDEMDMYKDKEEAKSLRRFVLDNCKHEVGRGWDAGTKTTKEDAFAFMNILEQRLEKEANA